MIKIIVSAWNNGRRNKTGGGYGVRIKRKDREKYFQKNWSSVIIELEGEDEVEVSVSPSFWGKCRELRKKEIGKWLINNKLAPWKKFNPPKLILEQISNNKFRLSGIRGSRKSR